jgi:hypothetical protein
LLLGLALLAARSTPTPMEGLALPPSPRQLTPCEFSPGLKAGAFFLF